MAADAQRRVPAVVRCREARPHNGAWRPAEKHRRAAEKHKQADEKHRRAAEKGSVYVDRNRKATEDSATLSSAHSKDCKDGRNRRGKRPGKEVEEKGTTEEEASKGYIHVRARRGQATDSHSLAERVRRERISERMRMLQALVPGCDKVTGKALILDEIINYVQSLQNQVVVNQKKTQTNQEALMLNCDTSESFLLYIMTNSLFYLWCISFP